MKKMVQDFKNFALKGNVVDMAVGVMIGGAFSKIVTSLVNDIIMPLISLLLGKVDFTKFQLVLAHNQEADVVLKYGMFLQNIIDFLIIAICIFTAVKLISHWNKKPEAAPAEPVISEEVQLLRRIADSLDSAKK